MIFTVRSTSPACVDVAELEGVEVAVHLHAAGAVVVHDLRPRLRIGRLDVGKRQPEEPLRDLAGRGLGQAAGLRIDAVLALVRGARLPEAVGVVGAEALRRRPAPAAGRSSPARTRS